MLKYICLVTAFTFCFAIDAQSAGENGLVGHWNFQNKSGADLTKHGNNIDLKDATFYPLEGDNYALEFYPKGKSLVIPVQGGVDNPLAINEGTISVWLNAPFSSNFEFVNYSNGAFDMRSYRGYLQPRFRGETTFKFSGGLLNSRWHEHLLREDAFYPVANALLTNNTWHQFTVSFDYEKKRMIGWRDGELIMEIDLSDSDVEPLTTEKLRNIELGKLFTGYLGEVRIYDRPFNDKKAKSLYDETKDVYANRQDKLAPLPDKKMEVYQYSETDEPMYSAWLAYPKLNVTEPTKALFQRVIVQTDNITVNTAAKELAGALNRLVGTSPPIGTDGASAGNVLLGTPTTSPLIQKMAAQLGLDRVKDDGFVLKHLVFEGKSYTVVAAVEPAGVIFGTYELIRTVQKSQNYQDVAKLDVLSNPKVKLRIVGHWDWMRGNDSDDWRGNKSSVANWESNRHKSIFSWEDLRTGNTKAIEDWARLCASVGWNGICPSEINWQEENNFLNNLDEVEKLAHIFRKYGIKLYWTPNFLLALDPNTAKTLYGRVPDFGGYLLKLGSEAQLGNPFPKMVNPIAQTVKPYGGHVLVRGFVYGKYRYAHITEVFRNTMPYDIFVPNDEKYESNVVIVGKGSPLDWDLAAPISSLDGAFKHTKYGTEMVVAKSWPASWVGKWKWWFDFDNYRNGQGSYNKDNLTCVLGVAMISPSPAWTSNPMNMVNYFGMGRLAWNPDISLDTLYEEWITATYGNDAQVQKTVKEIITLSGDVLKDQYIYRGYRGVWIDDRQPTFAILKSPYVFTTEGVGPKDEAAQKKVLSQYSPELQKRWGTKAGADEFLPYFHFARYDDKLANGRTVKEDILDGPDRAVIGAKKMSELWNSLDGKITPHTFAYTRNNFAEYIKTTEKSRKAFIAEFEQVLAGTRPKKSSASFSEEGGE